MAGSAYDDDEEDDEGEWAQEDTAWTEEVEVEDEIDAKDESNAYLEFLNEEVWLNSWMSDYELTLQAQKFRVEEDDELGEESLLETPLDKVEPYQLFRDALMSKFVVHLI